VVEKIAKLYAIEGQIRNNSMLKELAICQKRVLEAGPILAGLKSYLEEEAGKVLPAKLLLMPLSRGTDWRYISTRGNCRSTITWWRTPFAPLL